MEQEITQTTETQNDTEKVETQQDFENKLKTLSYEMYEIDKQYKSVKNIYDAKKEEYKTFLKEHNLVGYQDDSVLMKLQTIEKQSLDERATLNFLRKNGYQRFIHTKEYFDIDELYMAATRNELDVTKLNDFRVVKKEQRLIIK